MLEVDPKIRTKIVKLRKVRTTISNISENTGISTPYVSTILKDELGDKYDDYNLTKKKRNFSDHQKNTVVTLRKNGITLEDIEGITGIFVYNIQEILEEELGEERFRYMLGYHWQKYEKGWLKEEAAEVLVLRDSGKSLKEIREMTNTSDGFVKRILIKNGDKDLKPDTWKYRRPLTKEQVITKFKEWYYKFARAVTPKMLGSMKTEALKTFLNLVKGLTQPSHKIDQLIPVFVYSFFRTKGIDITFPLFKKLSGLTRHEIFCMLKKIGDTFPEYIIRNRKQIILNKINTVKSEFHFNYLFYKNADKILRKLWDILSNTTDRVVAGTVSTLALISINGNSPINNICQKLEIKQSTVIYQIKKLVNKFEVSGFTTLGESKDLIYSDILERVVGV